VLSYLIIQEQESEIEEGVEPPEEIFSVLNHRKNSRKSDRRKAQHQSQQLNVVFNDQQAPLIGQTTWQRHSSDNAESGFDE